MVPRGGHYSRAGAGPLAPNSPKPLQQLEWLVRRPNKGMIVGTMALLVLVTIFFASREGDAGSGGTGGRESLAAGEGWEGGFEAIEDGWIPVDDSSPPPPKSLRIVPVSSASTFSDECAELWVARGELCRALEGGFEGKDQIDVLYTYSNGSDPLLAEWRHEASVRLGKLHREGGPPLLGDSSRTLKHFREHDELRYSLRSLLAAFDPRSIRRIHLLTTDLPSHTLPSTLAMDHSTSEPLPLVGLVPTWLNKSTVASPRSPLQLVHHSSIFPSGNDSRDWINGSLPTFNSMAIESRFAFLDGLHEHVFYMNDDCFIMGKLSASDVASPFLGPVFRMQRDLTVTGMAPDHVEGDPDGEWPGLRLSNHLLNERFGESDRAYLSHIAKSLSMPLLAESSEIWSDELSETSQSRFRGQRNEFQPSFLATHFIIERHREALLWSFFVARADRDLDGSLSPSERQQLLQDLGYGDRPATGDLEAFLPIRSTLAGMEELHIRAGVDLPLATSHAFDSRDGFAGFLSQVHGEKGIWPVVHEDESTEESPRSPKCVFVGRTCLGDDFADPLARISTNDLFRRIAFDHRSCGDCAILLLVEKSGPRGLEAFLPEESSRREPAKDDQVRVLGMAKRHGDVEFVPSPSRNIRRDAIRLIQRYSYTIGDSSSQLVAMRTPVLVIPTLVKLNSEFAIKYGRPPLSKPPPTFVTLNDDFLAGTKQMSDTDRVLHTFFEMLWKTPTQWEKRVGVAEEQ